MLMFLVAALHMGAGDGGVTPTTAEPLPIRALYGSILEGTHSVNPKGGPNPGG